MIFFSLSLVNSEALLLKPLSHWRGDKDKSKVWIKNVFVLLSCFFHLHQAEIILVASTSWTQPFPLLIGMEWETNTQSVSQTDSIDDIFIVPSPNPPFQTEAKFTAGTVIPLLAPHSLEYSFLSSCVSPSPVSFRSSPALLLSCLS